jgi:hypothetical protein
MLYKCDNLYAFKSTAINHSEDVYTCIIQAHRRPLSEYAKFYVCQKKCIMVLFHMKVLLSGNVANIITS